MAAATDNNAGKKVEQNQKNAFENVGPENLRWSCSPQLFDPPPLLNLALGRKSNTDEAEKNTVDKKLSRVWWFGAVDVRRRTRVVARVSQTNSFQRQRRTRGSSPHWRVDNRLDNPLQRTRRVACNNYNRAS